MPAPRLTARSMLSLGTELDFALAMASASVGLPAGSPPPVRAATSTFLISFAKSLPRRASTTAFLCFVVAHLEWPLTDFPLSRSPRRAGAREGHPTARDGRQWRAVPAAVPRRSYRRNGPAPRPCDQPTPPTARG